MRSKRNLGPRRIQAELIRLHSFKLSTATIWKVLNRHGMNRLRSGRAPRQPMSYSRDVPGERVQIGQFCGGTPEVGDGDAPLELFSKDDVREFAAELEKMTPPDDPVLKAEYVNLVAMTKAALADADLTPVHMLA